MERVRKLINATLAALLVCGAAGGFVYLQSTRSVPPKSAVAALVPEVAVLPADPQVFDAPVVGYGTIRPVNEVKIIPQVSGMLVGMHPELAVGKYIRRGEVLFEIDRRAYESQVLQVEADIRMLEVQLRQQEQTRVDMTERLAVAREQLRLADENLQREVLLLEDGATRDVEVDGARQKSLQFKDVVLGYESQLALIPYQIDEINARLDARRAQLADAERNLDNTRIVAPFDARVDLVSARTAQVVVASLVAIAVLTDVSALELAAVLDPSEMRWTERRAYARLMGGDQGDPPTVTVSWMLHDQHYSWTGRVSRLERHDETTRTARVVVEVPQSLEEIRASEGAGKPPLAVGMFCAAEIPAEPLADALVLPRSTIREGNVVYVFEPDSPGGRTGRLALRQVPILRNVDDHVLVDFAGRGADEAFAGGEGGARCELRPGELVITSPLPRVAAGMKLRLRTREVSPADSTLALACSRAGGSRWDVDQLYATTPRARANLAESTGLGRLLIDPARDAGFALGGAPRELNGCHWQLAASAIWDAVPDRTLADKPPVPPSDGPRELKFAARGVGPFVRVNVPATPLLQVIEAATGGW